MCNGPNDLKLNSRSPIRLPQSAAKSHLNIHQYLGKVKYPALTHLTLQGSHPTPPLPSVASVGWNGIDSGPHSNYFWLINSNAGNSSRFVQMTEGIMRKKILFHHQVTVKLVKLVGERVRNSNNI